MPQLKDLLSPNLLKNKRIGISEVSFTDVTFLLHSLSEIYDNLRILSFYKNKQYYEEQGLIADTIFDQDYQLNEEKTPCYVIHKEFNIKETSDIHNSFESNQKSFDISYKPGSNNKLYSDKISSQIESNVQNNRKEKKKPFSEDKGKNVNPNEAPVTLSSQEKLDFKSTYQADTREVPCETLLIDDYYTANHVLGLNIPTTISIYRSDSFNFKYSPDYDLIFLVTPLKSGISSRFGGILKIMERDRVHLVVKYKMEENGNITFCE